mmetsp:Transcript_11784/g.24285  ORF Transcript_11784/g.24285 Transcript_11784/m.24285 type:complete len:138 (-) Transcript_11784:628-1041(-)
MQPITEQTLISSSSNGLISTAITSVKPTFLLIVCPTITATVPNPVWIINFTIRIQPVELFAVAIVPPTLFRIVFTAMAAAIAYPSRIAHVAVGVLQKINAISPVPPASCRIEVLTTANAISYPMSSAYGAVRIFVAA